MFQTLQRCNLVLSFSSRNARSQVSMALLQIKLSRDLRVSNVSTNPKSLAGVLHRKYPRSTQIDEASKLAAFQRRNAVFVNSFTRQQRRLSFAATNFYHGESNQEQYNQGNFQLPEVEWEPKIANSVNLIGVVGQNPMVNQLQSGVKVANTSLAVKRGGKSDVTDWISLEFWDEMAELAHQCVAKGMRIHVEGRLKVDEWEDRNTGLKRSRPKVVVKGIHRIRSDFPPGGPPPNPNAYTDPQASNQYAANQPADNFSPPQPVNQWGDQSPSAPHPSFSNEWGGDQGGSNFGATPAAAPPTPSPPAASVVEEYDWGAPPAAAEGFGTSGLISEKEELWQSVINSPADWWDNRFNKRNSRGPDFTSKAVNAQGEKDALWLNNQDTPDWVLGKLAEKDAVKEQVWMDVFNNPDNWWDNRFNKTNPRGPDFSCKEEDAQGNKVALWISSNDTPSWVADKLAQMGSVPASDDFNAGFSSEQPMNAQTEPESEPPF